MSRNSIVLAEKHHTRRNVDYDESARTEVFQSCSKKGGVSRNVFDDVEEENGIVTIQHRGFQVKDIIGKKAASPWFWKDLRGAAPAVVATAAFDPLVDEGNAWAERLRAAGVPVRHHCYGSMIHGFISMTGAVVAAREAVDEVCADLAQMLRS